MEKVNCKCGSGKTASTIGRDKNGKVVLTRCSKCEPSVSDSRSVGAITSRH